ncbi:MAG: response regulator [Calditrichia bacterium]|nr:response regulator [Calditrichia bacterium]
MSNLILVVDDDAATRKLLTKYLNRGGYKVVALASGEETLDYLKENSDNIQLIIADLFLEDITGFTLIQEARKINQLLEFIIITGHTCIDSVVEAVRLGAADYVFKPISGEDLLFRVKSVLDKVELKHKLLDAEKKLMYQATITTANHEINQPLTVIVSGIDILKMELNRIGNLTPHIENYLDLIYNSSQRIASILRKFRQIQTPVVKDVNRGMKLIELDEGMEEKLVSKINMLVIEDEVNVKNVVVKILSKYKLKVEAVENGTDALNLAKENDFNLILMDLNLPDITSYELLEKLKELRPESKIILMTGYSDEKEIQELIDKGANDFIFKPFDANALYSRIWNLYKRSS